MKDEFRVTVTVLCRDCGTELGYQFFNIDSDRSVDVDVYVCPNCRDAAYERGRAEGETEGLTRGYEDGYDDGYDEGSEANIEFVDDDEPTKDSE